MSLPDDLPDSPVGEPEPADADLDAPDGASSESIAQLVQRAQLGERVAFGQLYDRFAPRLQAVADRLLKQRRDSGDLVHDVFLEAWQHIREYDAAKGSFRTWLLMRLRSRAWDALARADARTTRLLHEGEQLESVSAPEQEHALEQNTVRAALDDLEEGVRGVLDQSYFEGLSAREIAERTGLPVGTVKSRLARGLSALAAALGERAEQQDE
ncbi:MAG TPA: sigma-70 family RNA polymerase sigma factor [Polyangiales bacterium]